MKACLNLCIGTIRSSPELLTQPNNLDCSVTVVTEFTGTYGDALRYQFRRLAFEVFQASAKRVSDAREIYDGASGLGDCRI